MKLSKKRILLTGATGGLGQALAKQLVQKGASVSLVGRNTSKLLGLQNTLINMGGDANIIVGDLSQTGAIPSIYLQAKEQLGTIDLLINNAGILDFTELQFQSDSRIAEIINTNVTALIQLTRHITKDFQKIDQGHFVFIGSIFGSLGFPHYATYCASKFAVHGFSQALRRELVDTNIGITYVAPRAIATEMNSERTAAMLKKAGQKMDTAEDVAEIIIKALLKEKQEVFIGQPQSFFAWLNGLAPKLVNLGLKKQVSIAKSYLSAVES